MPEHQGDIFSGMKPEYFSNPQYGQIFRTAMDIYTHGGGVSVRSLERRISGGAATPTWFTPAVTTDSGFATIPAHIPELKEYIIKDHIFTKFKENAAKATSVGDAERAAVDLLDVATALEYDNEPPLKQEGEKFIAKQEALRSGEITWGYSLGSPGLDKYVTLTPGGLYVIGGIKKGGKTQFVLSILDHNLRLDPPVPCMMFSIEMSTEQVLRKLVAKRTKINSRKVLSKFIDDREMGEIADAVRNVARTPLHINQSPAVTMVDIHARTRTWLMKNAIPKGNGIVVVDFVQLINRERNKYESEATTLKNIAFSLAKMAKQTETAVVATAQFNNSAERQVPHVSYIEGSGGIGQAADAIILMDLVKLRGNDDGSSVGSGLDSFNVMVGGQRYGDSCVVAPMYADLATSNFYDKGD